MSWLMLILVGAVAGLIATRMMKIEAGLLPTVGIGILGALVGGVLLRLASVAFSMVWGLGGAVLGAVILLAIWQSWRNRP
jgi:uncharacterized membrane protein YeaQ/YmgE (transglycosylase-associated protein family)